MKEHQSFYKKYGVYNITDVVNPTILDINSLELPRHSIIHNVVDEVASNKYPNNKLGLLRLRDIDVVNILEFKTNTAGIKKHIKEIDYVKDMNKRFPLVNTILEMKSNRLINKLNKELLVYNYGLLLDNYRFKDNRLANIEKIKDFINTIWITVKDVSNVIKDYDKTHQYIVIDTPDVIHNSIVYNKYINDDKIDGKFANLFYNLESLLLLELFKYVVDPNKNNYFKELLDSKHSDNISFIFKNNGKAIIYGLNEFMCISQKCIKDCKFKKIDEKIYLKILVKIFNTLSVVETNDVIDMERVDHIKYLNKKEEEDNVDVDLNVDDMLDAEDEITSEEDMINEAIKEIENDTLEETDVIVETYKNMYDDGDLNLDNDDIDKTNKILKEKLDNNTLNKVKYSKLHTMLNEVNNIKSPYDKDKLLKDYLVIENKDLELKEDDYKLPTDITSFVKEHSEDRLKAMDDIYFNKVYKKDMIRTLLSIQKSGLIVNDIKIEDTEDILGDYQIISIKVSDLGNSTYTITKKIPKIDDEGTYSMSGNKYRLKRQKIDVPIKKIAFNKVGLNTAFGKVNIMKAHTKATDKGYSIRNYLIKHDDFENVIMGSESKIGLKLPQPYLLFSRYIKSFYKDNYRYMFNYKERLESYKHIDETIDIVKLEKSNKSVFIGYNKKTKHPIFLNNDGMVYLYDKKMIEIKNIFDMLEIPSDKIKNEFTTVRIFKANIAVGLLLTYYMGITNLLKVTKTEHIISEKNTKKDGYFNIRFNNKTLLIKKDNGVSDLIYYGLARYQDNLKEFDMGVLDNKYLFKPILAEIGLKLPEISEIELLENMYVDPVSENILKRMKEPTTFIGLLLRSNEMLVDDNYEDPYLNKGFIYRGYEKVPQLIYKSIVNSLKKKKNEEFFGRSKLDNNIYDVWNMISEDPAGSLVDDLNPIIYLKQKEDTTRLGIGGVNNKEIMTKETRGYAIDDIGLISESSKESSDVGITAYLSANPLFKSVRGEKDVEASKNINFSNVLSTSVMLAPFTTQDDPKRVLFVNVQSSHVVPIEKPNVTPIRTGYEAIFPYRLNKQYVAHAREDGVVTDITKDKITIKYKDGESIKYDYKDWTSKEENNSSFLNNLVTDLKVKDKIKKNDVIYYSKQFFEPDMFNNKRVIYRVGTMLETMFIETQGTYEDAFEISSDVIKDTGITTIKIIDKIIDGDAILKNVKKVNDKLTPNDILFNIVTQYEELMSEKEKNLLDLMSSITTISPKAKYSGELIKIVVFYNAEYDDLSDSIKDLIKISGGKKDSNRVNSSFSVKGVPLDVGSVYIKFYIKAFNTNTTGDKGIFANQLKATVTKTFNEKLITKDSNVKIDAKFSFLGVSARIVESTKLIGTTSLILKTISENAVKEYEG